MHTTLTKTIPTYFLLSKLYTLSLHEISEVNNTTGKCTTETCE